MLQWKTIDCKTCENYTLLENKVKYLIKTCAKFTRGKEIF